MNGNARNSRTTSEVINNPDCWGVYTLPLDLIYRESHHRFWFACEADREAFKGLVDQLHEFDHTTRSEVPA